MTAGMGSRLVNASCNFPVHIHFPYAIKNLISGTTTNYVFDIDGTKLFAGPLAVINAGMPIPGLYNKRWMIRSNTSVGGNFGNSGQGFHSYSSVYLEATVRYMIYLHNDFRFKQNAAEKDAAHYDQRTVNPKIFRKRFDRWRKGIVLSAGANFFIGGDVTELSKINLAKKEEFYLMGNMSSTSSGHMRFEYSLTYCAISPSVSLMTNPRAKKRTFYGLDATWLIPVTNRGILSVGNNYTVFENDLYISYNSQKIFSNPFNPSTLYYGFFIAWKIDYRG
jgi:hypothetical protein